MKKNKMYKKLPGRRRKFIGTDTLWIGPDHLLKIESSGFAERYKRFYFKDIQSIVTGKTWKGKGINAMLIILCLVSAVPGLFSQADMEGTILLLILAAVFFFLLLWNLFLGPTCITCLTTAVQKETLESISRIKQAEKILAIVKPRIVSTQGQLAPEGRGALSGAAAGRAASAMKKHAAEASPLKNESGNMHAVLFLSLVFTSGLYLIELFHGSVILTLLETFALILISISAITALVKQSRSRMDQPIKVCTWCSLAFIILSFISGYAIHFTFLTQHMADPQIINNQWEMIKFYSSMSPEEYPWLLPVNWAMIIGSLGVGLPGLVMIGRYKNGRR